MMIGPVRHAHLLSSYRQLMLKMRCQMKDRLLIALLIILSFSIIFPSSKEAAEINGTYFEDTITVGNTTLSLTGVGLLRYWGFKAYVGAFYLEAGSKPEDALSDTAKRIFNRF